MAFNNPQKFGKVAVAMGGHAAEREISLISGKAVLDAMLEAGINAIAFDTKHQKMEELVSLGVDRVFNIVHGRGGEDGQLQGALELLEIPYTGSGVLGSALGMDKRRTKICWKGANLPTAAWTLLSSEADLQRCAEEVGFPVIIKPALEGSSIGMAKANTPEELTTAWKEAMQFSCDVIAEQWINGPEYTVGILNGVALPVIRLETPHDFYDYEAKYKTDTTQYHCPCGLDETFEKQLQEISLKAFEIAGASGWGRVDLMLDKAHQPYLLEINTVPGMTDHSLVPMAAKQSGLSFAELVWEILSSTLPQVSK
jgi:D-alanine-D-alanine ligase